MQGALLSFMGLVLAFGLSLAVGRYEARRGAVTTEANALSTTYLRAQTLAEPVRTDSLELLKPYTDTSILLAHARPGSPSKRMLLPTAADSSVICGGSLGGHWPARQRQVRPNYTSRPSTKRSTRRPVESPVSATECRPRCFSYR